MVSKTSSHTAACASKQLLFGPGKWPGYENHHTEREIYVLDDLLVD